ncbi:MAG: hypothetical protein ACI9G1_000251 [Pirellulaceae bacterium]|jgi:hypothetical protein
MYLVSESCERNHFLVRVNFAQLAATIAIMPIITTLRADQVAESYWMGVAVRLKEMLDLASGSRRWRRIGVRESRRENEW